MRHTCVVERALERAFMFIHTHRYIRQYSIIRYIGILLVRRYINPGPAHTAAPECMREGRIGTYQRGRRCELAIAKQKVRHRGHPDVTDSTDVNPAVAVGLWLVPIHTKKDNDNDNFIY